MNAVSLWVVEVWNPAAGAYVRTTDPAPLADAFAVAVAHPCYQVGGGFVRVNRAENSAPARNR